MSIDTRIVPLAPGSEPGVMNIVTLDSLGGKPIDSLDQLIEVIGAVRSQFRNSLIAIERDAIDRSHALHPEQVQNSPENLGWHTHQGYDTIHISNDSPVPTEIVLTVKAAAEGILKMLDKYSSLTSHNHPFSIGWGTERGAFYANGPLGKQVLGLRAKLIQIYSGKARDPDVIQQTFDHSRMLFAQLAELGVVLHREAQESTASKYRVTLRPRDYGAYVIPSGIVHARSLIGGVPEARQTLAELSSAITLDCTTGQIQSFEDFSAATLAGGVHQFRF